MEYANQYQIILNVNDKSKDGEYPLLTAIKNNNIEKVKLLIEYASQHKIALKLNEKDKFGRSPLIWAIINDNVEVVKLLIKYALQNKITLEYDIYKMEIDAVYYNYIKLMLQNYEKEIGKKV